MQYIRNRHEAMAQPPLIRRHQITNCLVVKFCFYLLENSLQNKLRFSVRELFTEHAVPNFTEQ